MILSINRITATKEPVLRDVPVVFHGVNKSGSLAMATVLRQSYARQGDSARFMCRYMDIPDTRAKAVERMKADQGRNQILIDHGLIGLEKQVPKVRMITMLRHPIRRIISAYYWLSTRHPEQILGRDLLSFVRMEGIQRSQIRQFAFDHFSGPDRGRIVGKSLSQIAADALDYFDRHIAWFGITEMFEESVLTLHWELGLGHTGVIRSDDRNKKRPAYQVKPIVDGEFNHTHVAFSKAYFDELEHLMSYDIVFYEIMKMRFRRYLEQFDFNGTLERYKTEGSQT